MPPVSLPQLLTAPRVLDVTLRDGGYLNDWRFSDATVDAHVRLLDALAVPFIEVGYIGDDPARPSTLRCDPAMLGRAAAQCANARLVAMLGVTGKTPEDVGRCLKGRTDLAVVRLTCLLERVEHVLRAAEAVRAGGTACSINLISITAYEPDQIAAAAARIRDAGAADWLYLADSRGALLPSAAADLFALIRRAWEGPLGFHAHDNLGHAVTNSGLALAAGFDLIDGSLNGYGLGGGNTDLARALDLLDPAATAARRGPLADLAARIAREIPAPPPFQHLYPLTGRKNLEQEWAPDVWRAFGDDAEDVLDTLAWQRYKDVDEVLDEAQRNGTAAVEQTGIGDT